MMMPTAESPTLLVSKSSAKEQGHPARDPNFWDELYKAAGDSNSGIEWNAASGHPMLLHHKDLLIPSGSVLVPLCGKSVDLAVLHKAAGQVVGIEFSEVAAMSFFQERQLSFERLPLPGGNVLEFRGTGAAHGIRILQGDFFDVTPAMLGGHFSAAYDCRAMVALPPELHERYAKKLVSLLKPDASILLIATEYVPSEWSGPPFKLDSLDVHAAYSSTSAEILKLSERSLVEQGVVLQNVDYIVPQDVQGRMTFFKEVALAIKLG